MMLMSAAQTAVAANYRLTVNSSGASGVAITSTTGQGGTTNYTRNVTSGTGVTLTAPSTSGGATFSGWTGDVTSSNRTITFTMTAARTVTATYTASATRIIRVDSTSLQFGSVQANHTSTMLSTIYNDGKSPLTVSSIGYPNGFSGDWTFPVVVAAGGSQVLGVIFAPTAAQVYSGTVTINSDATSGSGDIAVSGTGAWLLTVASNPSGGGSVSATPSSPNGLYVSGTAVVLTANANAGYCFSTWSGDLSGSSNSVTVTLNGDKNVTANFTMDSTPPVITLTGNAAVTVECGLPYTDAGATASDSCRGNLTSSIATANSVNTATVGTYTIRYNVSDGNGNDANEVTRLVHVVDTKSPVLSLSGSASVTLECHTPYADAGATASDSCAGDLTLSIVTTNPVNAAAAGTYTIRYNVSDGNGHSAKEVTRTVNVVDTKPPALTLNGSTGEWTRITEDSGSMPVYGTQGVPDPANRPGGRWRSVSWTGASGIMWVFGGAGYASAGRYGCFNDLWQYDPATGNWTWMKGASTGNQSET